MKPFVRYRTFVVTGFWYSLLVMFAIAQFHSWELNRKGLRIIWPVSHILGWIWSHQWSEDPTASYCKSKQWVVWYLSTSFSLLISIADGLDRLVKPRRARSVNCFLRNWSLTRHWTFFFTGNLLMASLIGMSALWIIGTKPLIYFVRFTMKPFRSTWLIEP